jgi:hypothetical protein
MLCGLDKVDKKYFLFFKEGRTQMKFIVETHNSVFRFAN